MTKFRKILEFLAKIGSLELFKILWNALAVNTTLKSIISLSLNVCQRKLATTFFEYT